MTDYAEHRGRAQSYRVLLICPTALVGMLRSAAAQAPPPMPLSTVASPSLSGRVAQVGSVTTTQSTANQGETGGSNLITTTITVQGGYQGSVPSGDNTGTVLPLGLDYALKLGLRNNCRRLAGNAWLAALYGRSLMLQLPKP
jgi:hypothetical protein